MDTNTALYRLGITPKVEFKVGVYTMAAGGALQVAAVALLLTGFATLGIGLLITSIALAALGYMTMVHAQARPPQDSGSNVPVPKAQTVHIAGVATVSLPEETESDSLELQQARRIQDQARAALIQQQMQQAS